MSVPHRQTWLLVVLPMLAAPGCGREAGPAPLSSQSPSEDQPAQEPFAVRLTGHNFTWRLRYPGADRSFDTPDDLVTARNLHLPANRKIRLGLCSDDYVYSLYLPQYELVQMAFPGRPLMVEFTTGSAGTSRLLGSQMCGLTHEELLGDLVVMSEADFRQWSDAPAVP